MHGTTKVFAVTAGILGAATLGVLLPVNTDNPAPRPFNVVEHDCSKPAQGMSLAKQFPNDDVILTTSPIAVKPSPSYSIDPSAVSIQRPPAHLQNCLTTGDRKCGPRYKSIDDTDNWRFWANWIRSDHNNYDPYRCLVKIGDTSIIVCQDGWMTTS
jgi:hypothetical protein